MCDYVDEVCCLVDIQDPMLPGGLPVRCASCGSLDVLSQSATSFDETVGLTAHCTNCSRVTRMIAVGRTDASVSSLHADSAVSLFTRLEQSPRDASRLTQFTSTPLPHASPDMSALWWSPERTRYDESVPHSGNRSSKGRHSTGSVVESPSIVFRSNATVAPTTQQYRSYETQQPKQESYASHSSAQRISALLYNRPATTAAPHRNDRERLQKAVVNLLRRNRERLAFRSFQTWVSWSQGRQRRSVFASKDASRSYGDTLRSVVESLWNAQEQHTATVKAVLESVMSQRPHQTSIVRNVEQPSNDTLEDSRRPLSRLLHAQGSQALVVAQRQADIARRSILQQELNDREHIEMDFRADRTHVDVAKPLAMPSRSHGSTVARLVHEFDERDHAAKQAALRDIASNAAQTMRSREIELEVARISAREQSARKLLAVAEGNAVVALFAQVSQLRDDALFQDRERSLLRQSTSGVTRRQMLESSQPRTTSVSFKEAPATQSIRPRAGSLASPSPSRQPTNARVPSADPSSPLRRTQSMIEPAHSTLAQSAAVDLLAWELKGRKAVIKQYKLGLESIVERVAAQAERLSR